MTSRVGGQFQQPHPHLIYGGTQNADGQQIVEVKLLLRSGHTVRAHLTEEAVQTITNTVSTDHYGDSKTVGVVKLPLGVVQAAEITGVVRIETTRSP